MTKYIFLLGTLMICGTIFFFSSQSIADSGRISKYVAQEITSGSKKIIKTENVGKGFKKVFIDHIRKWAHVWLYLVMAVMLGGYFSHYRMSSIKIIAVVMALCFLYACTDEFHQFFSENRGSRFTDVLIDSCGAFAGILLTRLTVFFGKKL